jgi:hypothetical protein
MGRAPTGSRHLDEPKLVGLTDQLIPQIQLPGSLPLCRRTAALHDLRTYFIAITTYPYTTVHYNVTYLAPRLGLEALDPSAQYPSRGAPPAGVEQGNSPSRSHQIHRDAVGNGYGKQNAGACGNPPIDPLDMDPAVAGIEAHDLDAMHLVSHHSGGEFRQLAAECAPAAHHLTNRCIAPEAEIESTTGLATSPGDTGNDPVTFPPIWNFKSGHLADNKTFTDLR